MGLLVVRRREKTAKFAPNSGVALGIGNSSRARVAARNERKRDDFRLFLHEFHYADLERNRKIRHDFWNSSHRIDTQYEVLARVCYALLNKKRGESFIAEYSAICTRFSFALWKLLPNSPDFSLISKLPEILPVVFRHIPASAEFGSLLKNQGGRADEGWLFASLSVKSVCCLAEPVKQRAFSIFVLYMMRIEFVSAEHVADFFLGLWKKVRMHGERECRLLTRLLTEFLSLQRSACFRELCPEVGSAPFLNDVIDSVLGYWDKEGIESCEEVRALKAIDCGFLSLRLD
ncbi:uncharacterized protein [Blastocystis hominis]|uniref:Uncharacterized protein n=1 Tax=Blastocystis hominis TaxID=12968 RepID=D8M6A5_BLAHO|nr:uncharacterized protein [Blastocystis hominis]CBK23658.2 unnamed protein product [Blastocystis hominis]|eukprot:XP_012897706.1 uncharacterized protein [Blastocystis hominis]